MQKSIGNAGTLSLCALFVALIAVGNFIRIPIPPIPITLQLLFTALAGMLLGAKRGMICCAAYVLIGLCGFPIFTGGGGPQYIFHPTFGMLIGFVLGTGLTGFLVERMRRPGFLKYAAAGYAGFLVIYILGIPYYLMIMNLYMGASVGVKEALMACYIVFIPGDIVKDADDEYPYHNQISLGTFYADDGNQSVSKTLIRDYIGPSIDTGFRLGGMASPRKLVISVDLAYLLSVEQERHNREPAAYSVGPLSFQKFDFKYEGRLPLKGVLGGAPYPVIWIDLNPGNEVNQAEDEVLQTPKPNASQVKVFAESFMKTNANYLRFPYFWPHYNLSAPYSDVPEEHLDKMMARRAKFEQTKAKRIAENEVNPEGAGIEKAADGAGETAVDTTLDFDSAHLRAEI